MNASSLSSPLSLVTFSLRFSYFPGSMSGVIQLMKMPGVICLNCWSFYFFLIFSTSLSPSAVMKTQAPSLCPWSGSGENVSTMVTAAVCRKPVEGDWQIWARWILRVLRCTLWESGRAGLICPPSKLFRLSGWRQYTCELCRSRLWAAALWAPASGSRRALYLSSGLYNLGSAVRGGRNPALADGSRLHDLIASFPLES